MAFGLILGLVLSSQKGTPGRHGLELGPPPSAHKRQITATVGFAFDIKDLLTNHQFAGQKNTFHVSYTYARVMAGGGFDPAGHKVSADVYPYFQQVRDGMIAYALHYKPADDFYELYAYNIADHVLKSYPQIREIVLDVDVPAHGGVNFDRSVHVDLVQK